MALTSIAAMIYLLTRGESSEKVPNISHIEMSDQQSVGKNALSSNLSDANHQSPVNPQGDEF